MASSSSTTRRRNKGKQQQQQHHSPPSTNSQPAYHKHSPSSKVASEKDPLEAKEILLTKKKSQQEMLRHETAKIVLWRQPLRTLNYSLLEFIYLIRSNLIRLISYRKTLLLAILLLIGLLSIYFIEGTHQKQIEEIETIFLWSLYWLGLGIASSVGLGTGLHTFLLYLGPFIAQITIAAYECGSIKFPRPPYPNEIVCPTLMTTTSSTPTTLMNPPNDMTPNDFASLLLENGPISFWKILWKVKHEAFLWGLGTAFGELPPYFMARAARLGNTDDDDRGLLEFEQLLLNAELHNARDLSFFERLRYGVFRLIKRIGFWGILLCASIPNPLFDLAGITCGYFLIPFWTFFTATVLGKALIKMSIQTVFIIFLFSEHHMERIIRWMKHVPYYGRHLQTPFKEWLYVQKKKMHRKPGERLAGNLARGSMLSRIFDVIVAVMIGFFIVSIINSLAQRYYKRTRTTLKMM